ELKDEKQTNSIADVPFMLYYKKVFPQYGKDRIIISNSNPVLIDVKTKKLTFNISNLEPGSIYEVNSIEPHTASAENHKIQNYEHDSPLLEFLKDVEGLPFTTSKLNNSKKQQKIYFAPLNVPVSLESAWSHPLRYDYYEGEQVYIRFNKEAGTAINKDWLKKNLKVKLIPNKTYSTTQSTNQNPVEKELTDAGKQYSEKQEGQFNPNVVLSGLEWDPQKVTATFRLQPKSLKSIVAAQIQITIKDVTKYHLDPTQELLTTTPTATPTSAPTSSPAPAPANPPVDNSQSITFRLQSSAVVVTPTNVDYMNPGLIGFSYAIYDPSDLIQKTGKDYNPFGDFAHLTPYDEQDWLKVVINKQPSVSNSNKSIDTPDNNIFNKVGSNSASDVWNDPVELEIPEPPVAIRTKTDVGKGIKYLTLYWAIHSNTGVFRLPSKFASAKKLWYPAGKLVHLPISLQFKSQSLDSLSSTYSFALNSPYGTPGHIMPYEKAIAPHDARSIIIEGSNYRNRWIQPWGGSWEPDNLIPRINKFPKHISKVFWSAPTFEWTTHDRDLNDIFHLNRAIPRLKNSNTKSLFIQTGNRGSTGFRIGASWDILYVKNKDGNKSHPDLSRSKLNWDIHWQSSEAVDFENQNNKSSWIISITHPDGRPLLYDPLNYYQMLGPFKPPELPE
ncbi:hypothetical protein R7U32_02330, partial [Mesomycoplasma ovipneumoniae]